MLCTRRALRPALGGLLVALLAIVGCAGSSDDQLEIYPVTGKLLMDGEPFGPTTISLLPVNPDDKQTRSVTGEVDQQGNITFTSYERGDGAPAGQYKVIVGLVMAPPPKPFPELYRKADQSPLTVSVEPKDSNDLTIEMDSKAGPPARTGFGTGNAPRMGEPLDPAGATGNP